MGSTVDSPDGQHLEDTHVALVSCPSHDCSVHCCQHVGPTTQKRVVE
ncbi:hypothetical protein LEMLEM_LOCUS9592 [Lemmus lemmus]